MITSPGRPLNHSHDRCPTPAMHEAAAKTRQLVSRRRRSCTYGNSSHEGGGPAHEACKRDHQHRLASDEASYVSGATVAVTGGKPII
jgi:hypothetical protein